MDRSNNFNWLSRNTRIYIINLIGYGSGILKFVSKAWSNERLDLNNIYQKKKFLDLYSMRNINLKCFYEYQNNNELFIQYILSHKKNFGKEKIRNNSFTKSIFNNKRNKSIKKLLKYSLPKYSYSRIFLNKYDKIKCNRFLNKILYNKINTEIDHYYLKNIFEFIKSRNNKYIWEFNNINEIIDIHDMCAYFNDFEYAKIIFEKGIRFKNIQQRKKIISRFKYKISPNYGLWILNKTIFVNDIFFDSKKMLVVEDLDVYGFEFFCNYIKGMYRYFFQKNFVWKCKYTSIQYSICPYKLKEDGFEYLFEFYIKLLKCNWNIHPEKLQLKYY